MLSNSARRLSTALSRHQRNSLNFSMHRCFSAKPPQPGSAESSSTKSNAAAVVTPPSGTNADPANAAPKSTQPRSLPTRHSRHHRPAVAPSDVLDSNSETILASIPGTLFSYNSKNLHQSKTEEYEQALHECHSMQQKVEYLLRGYSSLLPGSIVDIASTEKAASTKDGDEIVAKMIKLLDRMEQEGKTYVELRSKFRSQLAHVSQTEAAHSDTNGKSNSSEDASDIGDSDPELPIDENTNTNAWKLNALVANFGAPPGPTNVMYDLILDAIAITIPSSKDPLALLRQSREIHSRSVRRYELDAKAGTDHMNPSSCPTPATFNAVIRAATAIQTGNDEVRDTAIENGLYAFNTMFHHTIVHRNSSTYKYTLDMIRTHFPPGEMRGNIVAGIWEKAVQDKVIDLAVIDAMRCISSDAHGELFDKWWKSVEEQFDANVKNGHGFPIVWGKYKKLRRFDKRFQTY